jgi:predicted kinase
MLVAMTGNKGSGKDTFAHVLVREFDFVHTRFADPLKNMLRTLFKDAGIDPEDYIEGPYKEAPCDILCGKTPRHAMQTLGTEWRDMIDRKLWTKLWRARVELYLKQGLPVIVTDCRFIHEAATIREMGGYIVRVERPTLRNDDQHISETEMSIIEADEVVLNIGSINQLHQKARNFFRDHRS